MTKELVIERLSATLARLAALPSDKFSYAVYLTKDDGVCGTVCCAAGWYPEWFPESGLLWEAGSGGYVDLTHKDAVSGDSACPFAHRDMIRRTLAAWHGLSVMEIEYLFYGMAAPSRPGFGSDDSLPTVIQRFKYVLNDLKNNITIQLSIS